MADEEIKIQLRVPEEFWDELDRRFEGLARRAADKFGSAFKSVGASSAGGKNTGEAAFGLATGGLGGAMNGGLRELAGAAGGLGGLGIGAATSFVSGFGQGIANTPAASASSPGVVPQNGLVGGVGSLINNTIGQVPIVGDFIKAQFNSVKEAMEVPTERGISRLKSIYGSLAASGVEVTDAERSQAISFTREIEKRRYEGERNLERQYREQTARESLTYGLSWIGR